MINRRLIKHIAIKVLQIAFTLATTLFLAYCMMNWGPADWILQSRFGRDALHWLMSEFDWMGCEGALDTLIVTSCGAVLPAAIWLCNVLTRYLRTLKVRGHKKCASTL